MTSRVHRQKGTERGNQEYEAEVEKVIVWIYFVTHTEICAHAHVWTDLQMLALCAWGDVENYRERTLVASISSLVSEKCDLKGRRIKGDKLFSTTVNRRELRAAEAWHTERRKKKVSHKV